MSSHLTWEPGERKKELLPDELKFVLQKRFGYPVSRDFDNSDYWYLRGIEDAGVKGADDLLDAIGRHGTVHVQEE